MYGAGPYREALTAPIVEEDLWLRLDDALLEAMREPSYAWGLAWNVVMDAQLLGFAAVEVAATSLLFELSGGSLPADCDVPAGHICIEDR